MKLGLFGLNNGPISRPAKLAATARGAGTVEFLDAMHRLWYDEQPEFHGSFADFAGVNAYPRPVQRPIPIVIGGRSRPALRRAVARGHGWYGFGLEPEEAAE